MPKLSVCFITYNHAKYVRQALESVLMQRCNFDWELVISDDCSTDGTAQIVKEFAAKHPDKVRLNVLEKNVGMTLNWVRSINTCQGEYIALLEGDDYWTDENKLQKQVDLLDKNPQLSFAAHDVGVIFEPGMHNDDVLLHLNESGTFTIHDYLSKQGFVQTGSVVFRKRKLPAFPDWTDKRVKCIDFLLYLLLASQAPFYYIAEKMGVYRLHEGGISHVNWRLKHNALEFDMAWVLEKFNTFSRGKFKKDIDDKLELLYMRLLKGNTPDSEAYQRAFRRIVFLRPAKHIDLVKGYIINHFVPAKIYNLYQKLF